MLSRPDKLLWGVVLCNAKLRLCFVLLLKWRRVQGGERELWVFGFLDEDYGGVGIGMYGSMGRGKVNGGGRLEGRSEVWFFFGFGDRRNS
ncbi:hypothetical protein J3E68DRAFT_416295 [Trichoderma sp. SZMC 28012]